MDVICPNCGWPSAAYKNPKVTVDIIIEIGSGIVLIERKNPPLGWALPGGFVDYGESLEQAAIREAKEETSLDVQLQRQFHAYSDPKRDQRFHTISVVFIGTAIGTPQGCDDALQAKIFTKLTLPTLAFDHHDILTSYYNHAF